MVLINLQLFSSLPLLKQSKDNIFSIQQSCVDAQKCLKKQSTHPATKLFVSFSRHFRALRKIKKGEELLHSYLGREFLGSNFSVDVDGFTPQGQGVKPHLNVLGHSVMAEIGHPPFAKLLFCRTFLL